jgi:major membrane immunogen (membrane-anchored lipoprotein)
MLTPIVAAALMLAGCSREDQAQARQDTHKAEQKIREGAKEAGREIKQDLHKADVQLKASMEKGKVAAQHAGKELRKELSSDDADKQKR